MVRERDLFWEHAEQWEDKFKCKFCDRTFAGGVSRVKSHLSGIKGRGIKKCSKVPEYVRFAAAKAIPGKSEEASSSKSEESMLIQKDGDMLNNLLAKFILLLDVDVDIVRSPFFIDFVNALAEHGSDYKLPCHSVVRTKLVPDLEKKIGEHVTNVKKSWDRTGCTLMSVIWHDKERSFINILACSIEGMVLLSTVEIPEGEGTSTFLQDIVCFVAQEIIGANNIVQYITTVKEGIYEDMPHVYQTNCVVYVTHLLFETIYNKLGWVRKAFDHARVVFTKICKHDDIFSSMKHITNTWELKQSSTINFYSDYYMLRSIMGVKSELQLLFSPSKRLSLDFEKDVSGKEVGEIIRNSEFWREGKEVLQALESIIQVLCLVDSYGATFGFLYAAVEMADEAIKQILESNVHKYQSFRIFFGQWRDDIIHPMHAAAAFLNPAYMCRRKMIDNEEMKSGIYFMLEKLVVDEEKENFAKEMQVYINSAPTLFSIAKTMLRTSHPCDWWKYCGDVLPVLKKYAIRILSQPCSTSFCKQSLSAFKIAQTEKREPFMPAVMDDYLYLRTNALLMENFNTEKEKMRESLDLEKFRGLPDVTEFINKNFTQDPLNKMEVPLSYGKLNCWSALASKDGETQKHLQLHFITKLATSLVRGNEVKGGRGTPIHVILVDSVTGRVVRSGPLSVLELVVTVIEGDFDERAGKNWTREFFESNEIMGQNNMPPLTGDLSVTLDKGVGTLGAITLDVIPRLTRSEKLRLGVKTALGCCGIRVLEGTSNAFAVEDGEGTSNTCAFAAEASAVVDGEGPSNAFAVEDGGGTSNVFAMENVGEANAHACDDNFRREMILEELFSDDYDENLPHACDDNSWTKMILEE